MTLAQTTPNPYLEGIAWSDLGVVYTELHDFAEADRALDHADGIWKRNGNPLGQLQTLEDRAELRLAAGDLARSREAFATGVDEAAKNSMAREHSYFLRGLAITQMRSGRFSEADRSLADAIAEAERVQAKDILSAMYSSSGELRASEHRWVEAAAEWQRADTLCPGSRRYFESRYSHGRAGSDGPGTW